MALVAEVGKSGETVVCKQKSEQQSWLHNKLPLHTFVKQSLYNKFEFHFPCSVINFYNPVDQSSSNLLHKVLSSALRVVILSYVCKFFDTSSINRLNQISLSINMDWPM